MIAIIKILTGHGIAGTVYHQYSYWQQQTNGSQKYQINL